MANPVARWRRHRSTGQGLVEFALVLPILLLLLLGVFEFGRLMVIYAGVTSASREAARFGAAVGDGQGGLEGYRDCQGIREAARRVSVLLPVRDVDIAIWYDNPNTGFYEPNCPPAHVSLGDRIAVRVSVVYRPIVPLVPLPEMPIQSEAKRTILKDVYIK